MVQPNELLLKGSGVKAVFSLALLPRRPYMREFSLKVLPWVVDGAGGLGAGKTSGAGTRGVDLNAAIGGRTGDSDTNRGESSNN